MLHNRSIIMIVTMLLSAHVAHAGKARRKNAARRATRSQALVQQTLPTASAYALPTLPAARLASITPPVQPTVTSRFAAMSDEELQRELSSVQDVRDLKTGQHANRKIVTIHLGNNTSLSLTQQDLDRASSLLPAVPSAVGCCVGCCTQNPGYCASGAVISVLTLLAKYFWPRDAQSVTIEEDQQLAGLSQELRTRAAAEALAQVRRSIASLRATASASASTTVTPAEKLKTE